MTRLCHLFNVGELKLGLFWLVCWTEHVPRLLRTQHAHDRLGAGDLWCAFESQQEGGCRIDVPVGTEACGVSNRQAARSPENLALLCAEKYTRNSDDGLGHNTHQRFRS